MNNNKPSYMNAADVQINKVPTVPGVLVRLIEACYQPDISFEELSQIIRQDAALSARIIAVGNSAAYSQWKGQRNFNQLLVVLGLETIKTIAITAAVQQFFSQFREDSGRRIGKLWQTSLGCAYLARRLARLTGYPAPDEAYLAGLLHNLGELVYLQEFGARYTAILETADSDQARDQRERAEFGASATEMGGYLAQYWLPDSFVSDALLFQREPADAVFDSPPLVKITNLAYKLTQDRMSRQQLLTEADTLFGLTEDVLDELLQKAETELGETLGSYGFSKDAGDPAVDDEGARMALGRHVRDAAMTGALGTGGSAVDPWQLVLRNFAIVFGSPALVGFKYEEPVNELRAQHTSGIKVDPAHLRQIRLPVQEGRNLLADACLGRHILFSTDEQLPDFPTVLDQQVRRVIGTTDLVALPLVTTDGNLLGAMAVGLGRDQVAGFMQQRALLNHFLNAAVQQLKTQADRLQEQTSLVEGQAERFHGEARKLVHEANNPLGIIKNYLQLLSMRLEQDETTREQIGVIRDEIDRVADILLRMRDIGSEAQLTESSVDLNALIREIVGVFRASLFTTHGISCELKLDESLNAVTTSRNSIKQVLTNLLKNAVEALGDGGRIQIETDGQGNLNGVPQARVVVADDGPGIPREILDKLFTPVASTKGAHHSGLGLVIVKNLVKEMNGSVFVHSTEESGTKFEILIPRD